MRQAMMFLQEYGISMNLAVKIYQEYGPRMYSVMKENPYQLADDIPGVGFKMADEIARRVGIFTDSDFRIKCGMLYTLLQEVGNGHTYLPEEELFAQAAELLKVDPAVMGKHLMDMQMDKRIVVKEMQSGESGMPEAQSDSGAVRGAGAVCSQRLCVAGDGNQCGDDHADCADFPGGVGKRRFCSGNLYRRCGGRRHVRGQPFLHFRYDDCSLQRTGLRHEG